MRAIIITQRNEIIFTEQLDSFDLSGYQTLANVLMSWQITAEYLTCENVKAKKVISSYAPECGEAARKIYEEIAKEVLETALAGDDYVAIINLGTINTDDCGLTVRPYTLRNR